MVSHCRIGSELAYRRQILPSILHIAEKYRKDCAVCIGALSVSHTFQPTIERYIVGFATVGAFSVGLTIR